MCFPDLGWERSGGESESAVAGVFYRLWARRIAGGWPGRTVASVSGGGCEGRHKAGTCGGLMGLAGRGMAGYLQLGTRHQCRHPVDEACCRRGGVAGAEPPHKGGPNRPDRPKLQWSVVSGQWSETALVLKETGLGTDHGFGVSRGMGKFAPILKCTPFIREVGKWNSCSV